MQLLHHCNAAVKGLQSWMHNAHILCALIVRTLHNDK